MKVSAQQQPYVLSETTVDDDFQTFLVLHTGLNIQLMKTRQIEWFFLDRKWQKTQEVFQTCRTAQPFKNNAAAFGWRPIKGTRSRAAASRQRSRP